MNTSVYERWLLDDRAQDPFVMVWEVSPKEAAAIALIDLADSDELWLEEQETTEYLRPALILEELDPRTLDELFELEDDEEPWAVDTVTPWHPRVRMH